MEREIKFRGYSEELKSFVYGFYQEVDVEGVGYSYIFWQGNTTPVSANSVAQFTGMYDKNGKEIYEGDLVKRIAEMRNYSDADGIQEQNYEVSYIGIELLPFSETGTDMTEYQIIGNIYQNPELLKLN